MRTLREEWTDFFSSENLVLNQNYPGLNLHRFMMEVEDLIKLGHNPLIDLEQSRYSVSETYSQKLKQKFLEGVPFAYLTGHSEFYGHHFYINDKVLVPRSETELLVDHLVRAGEKTPFKRALDIGTGSGVILLSLLAAEVALKGVGADISGDALKVAQINRHRLNLTGRCELVLSDRLTQVRGTFDLIVSNPPYIRPKSHGNLVHQKVDEFEPALALYIPDDQYEEWFEKLFKQVSDALEPGGLFMMEGHELELHKQGLILGQNGFREVRVINDYSGSPRFLQGKK